MVRALAQRLGATQVDAGSRAGRLARGARFMPALGARLRLRGRAVAGRRVILLDDVRTTGSTLRDAAAALRSLRAIPVASAVLAVRE